MLRKLFWILVAMAVVAVLWCSANSQRFTASQNLLIWTLAIDVVLVAFVAYGVGMMIYGFLKGSVILAAKRGQRTFSRTTEPVGYWLTMTYYLGWVLFCLCAFWLRNRELWQMH